MADTEKANTPKRSSTGNTNPESPTTARPLDFDDEPQETGIAPAPSSNNNTKTPSPTENTDDAPPSRPPRPVDQDQQASDDLKEAFPGIDLSVIKAVVMASGGNLERAFNALLGMSDPDAQDQELPPAKPPRPNQEEMATRRQLEEDERYARQLAEHYGGADPHRGFPREHERHRRETGLNPNELYDDREHSFIDDDLPVIKENIRKGFLETQTRVNAWVENFRKKIDGEESDEEIGYGQPQQGQASNHRYNDSQNYRARRSGEDRRSVDRERYDADPQVLGDDFSALELRDNEAPRRPQRPTANPDLFKPNSSSSDRRRVSFQEGPPEEIRDSYSGRSGSNNGTASPANNKSSKWQPLSTVEPSPVGENDPFSLGDSDDEKELKSKDTKSEDSERLRKATAEAMAGDMDEGNSAKDKPVDKA